METTSLREGDGFKVDIEVDVLPPAPSLTGFAIGERWQVLRLLHETPQETGGNFGVGYIVQDHVEKTECFLKLIDYPTTLIPAIRRAGMPE